MRGTSLAGDFACRPAPATPPAVDQSDGGAANAENSSDPAAAIGPSTQIVQFRRPSPMGTSR